MLQPSRLRLALARVAPIIAEVRATGTISLRAIAAELNSRGIPAPRGGRWSATAVMRVVEATAARM